MKNRFLGILLILLLSGAITQPVLSAGIGAFEQHYNAAQSYLSQSQYSSAIVEFRKALRINYLDNSARIGLINSYLSRAAYYANQEKNYDKAANDFRSSLFYLKMYPEKEQNIENAATLINSATENLKQCLKVIGADLTANSRYKKAEELRAIGNFSAAAYEFLEASKNSSLSSDANAQIADLMKLLGNEKRCADYYKIALDLDPNNGILRMKYARTVDKLGNYDEAVKQYNAALENSKGDLEVLYALERIYRKKLVETPSDAELNANIGAIKQAQGDFDAALSYYGKAEQLNPNNINTRINVGTLFQQKKEYYKAIKSYDSVLTLYPDNVQANLYKAQALSEMGDKKASLELYKKVLSLDPANSIAKKEVINVMQSTMSPEDFITYLQQNSSDKNTQNMLYDYALKMHNDKNTNVAIQAYRAVISANPSNVEAYVNLAICYASKNEYKNAISVLNNAKTKFPANNLVLKTLKDVQSDSLSTALTDASASYENKDYKKALSEYLAISPATESSLIGAAACYQALENNDKAIEYYKKAETISPKNAEIPYYIGYIYAEQEKWYESEGYLRKALKLNPQSDAKELLENVVQKRVAIMVDEGIALYDKKNYESALSKFNDIIKKDVNNPTAYYYRALIYDEQNKTSLAIKDYQNFVSKYTTEDEFSTYAKSRIEELKPYAG